MPQRALSCLILALVAGCGRSELEAIPGDPAADDSGVVTDDGGIVPDDGSLGDDSIAADDRTFPPPPPYLDVWRPPPFDVYVPPPDDGFPPPPDDAPTCGPATCDGCCEGDVCHPLANMPLGPGLCGGHGEACTYCTQFCYMGACGNLSTNCSPSSCAGCCAGNGACSDGTHATACGSGGGQCETCSVGATCTPDGSGGKCTRVPTPCDATSCATGCCINGICAQGSQDIACGSGGQQCVDCTASNLTCIFQQCGGGFNH